ncbi:methyltransferase domain-containing protein [Halovivax sp.]|uniref:methyltransferase domain-containing protein n=1 Tax=Halovivax sp. TaxID=1935978 RepID=UPI0025C213C3|nr:methyltransferase domain-containing protein [Halovivax sp.]
MYFLELGGEDDAFAALEARSAATAVTLLAPGVATAGTISPERVRGLAYTRRASELLGRTDADLESARALLNAASIDRAGTVAVRVTDVKGSTGVDTARAERVLGQVLVDRGFEVDLDEPDHVLRAAFGAGEVAADAAAVLDPSDEPTADGPVDRSSVCALGWQVAESVRDFGDRKPTAKPFFQPGSMDPLLARAVANVAGARPGATVLDPMCGTGGVLVEAGLVGADVVGTDAQSKMVRGARENLVHFLGGEGGPPERVAERPGPATPGSFDVVRADATALPLADGAVDGVVFDAPYGRQSKIETHDLEDLVAGALAESRRVADRAVIVADRSWAGRARAAGWTIEASVERRVHRSLTRYVLVLA